MTTVRTARYASADPYAEFSTRLMRHGWYINPATNESLFLEFTKIHDYARCRKTTAAKELEHYLYCSDLSNVVVIDCLVKERRLHYCSESEDEYCTTGPDPREAKRLSVYLTLAVKYSSARYTLVGTTSTWHAESEALPLGWEDGNDDTEDEEEFAEVEERVYRQMGEGW